MNTILSVLRIQKFLSVSLYLFCVFVLASCDNSSVQIACTYTLTGTTRSTDAAFLTGVKVTTVPASQVVYSSETSEYTIGDLCPGRYTILMQSNGYDILRDSINIGGAVRIRYDGWLRKSSAVVPPPQAESPIPMDSSTVSRFANKGLQLSWKNETSKKYLYSVKLSKSHNLDLPIIVFDSIKETNIVVPSLDSGVNYFWQVTTIGDSGSAVSPVWTFRMGGVDKSMKFNGVTSKAIIDSSQALSLNNDDLTLELWFRCDRFDNRNMILLEKQDSDNDISYSLQIDYSGSLLLKTLNQSQRMYSNYRVHVGEWCHVAVVYAALNHTATMYINGMLDVSSKMSVSNNGQSWPLSIGCELNKDDSLKVSNVFDGCIDELRMWRQARNAGDIQYYMHCSIATGVNYLSAYWNFNDSDEKVYYDRIMKDRAIRCSNTNLQLVLGR